MLLLPLEASSMIRSNWRHADHKFQHNRAGSILAEGTLEAEEEYPSSNSNDENLDLLIDVFVNLILEDPENDYVDKALEDIILGIPEEWSLS